MWNIERTTYVPNHNIKELKIVQKEDGLFYVVAIYVIVAPAYIDCYKGSRNDCFSFITKWGDNYEK